MKHADIRQRTWWALQDFHKAQGDKRKSDKRQPCGIRPEQGKSDE